VKEVGEVCADNIYQELKYEQFQARETIFKLGDTGKKFYIIVMYKKYFTIWLEALFTS
jgi:hypothetical protein